MADFLKGIILKCVGGFYYVEAADAVYECRARGIFRKSGITPVAGDTAYITVLDDETGWLEKIGARRNFLVRPPVANLDLLLVVVSITEPEPNQLLIDKTIAIAEKNGIEPVVVITKADLKDTRRLAEIYRKSGFEVFEVSSKTGQGIEELKKRLTGFLSVLSGNSGSASRGLLNNARTFIRAENRTDKQKAGAEQHTTRTAEIFKLSCSADCGHRFSTIDIERVQRIYKDELAGCFRNLRITSAGAGLQAAPIPWRQAAL